MVSSKIRFLVGGLAVVAATALLFAIGLGSTTELLTIAEVKALGPNQTRNSQVTGQIVLETRNYDKPNRHLTISIQDDTGTLTISYYGQEPAGMADAVATTAIGKYDPSAQVFEAEELRMKCPSKYEEEK